MKRTGLAGLMLAAMFCTAVAGAEATTTICVPERASTPVLSANAGGECPAKTIHKATVTYKAEPLPGEAELEQLDKLLPHVSYTESGVGGKPTIRFSGVNVQVVNGEGTTASSNGAGNLVIGYDENTGAGRGLPGAQTGSHDLILGEEEEFTSYGGILAGNINAITAPFASVVGGEDNTASASFSSVSGGFFNSASGPYSQLSGSSDSSASGRNASVTGGLHNHAAGNLSWIGGGSANTVGAGGEFGAVSGGAENAAEAKFSSVYGGKRLKATKEYEAIR
jgi:hypothetical protein